MSHSFDCPEPWEARRAAQLDHEYGGYMNRSKFDCEEAQHAYEREYRYQEMNAEEERRERAVAEHQRQMRQQAEYEEQQYLEQSYQEEQYRRAEAEHYIRLEAMELEARAQQSKLSRRARRRNRHRVTGKASMPTAPSAPRDGRGHK